MENAMVLDGWRQEAVSVVCCMRMEEGRPARIKVIPDRNSEMH
jgi:hypothetical protein